MDGLEPALDGLEVAFDGLEPGREPASRQSQSPALIIRLLRPHLRQLGDRRPKDNHPGISRVFSKYFPGISKDNHPGISRVFSKYFPGISKDNHPGISLGFSKYFLGISKDNHPGISRVFSKYIPGISKDNHPGISLVFSKYFQGISKDNDTGIFQVFPGYLLKYRILVDLYNLWDTIISINNRAWVFLLKSLRIMKRSSPARPPNHYKGINIYFLSPQKFCSSKQFHSLVASNHCRLAKFSQDEQVAPTLFGCLFN